MNFRILCRIALLTAVFSSITGYAVSRQTATRSTRSSVVEGNTPKHSAEYIKTRLQLVYALVFNSIETGTPTLSDYFFSDEFRALYKTAEELTPEGETGYYDYDPWLQAQDFKNPKADIGHVYGITKKTSTADVVVYHFGKSGEHKGTSVRVKLRFEHGDWFISDFNTDREGLQRYINSKN